MTTFQQLVLMRRMAWCNIQRSELSDPRPEDEKYIPYAVQMMLFVACLGYAMIDLETELTEAGLLRHKAKHRFRQALRIVENTHGIAYDMLQRVEDSAARQYNDRMEEAYRTIVECVLLEAPEKAYNIVIALCRLVEVYNIRLSGRYDFKPAKALYRIPALLDCIGIADYKLDGIIELNLKE